MNLIDTFQLSVLRWARLCFGQTTTYDRVERRNRFLEEALELVQAAGGSKDDALQLVEYVFNRPVGEAAQEVGGVMITLAALCSALGVNLDMASNDELERVWKRVSAIRAKHKTKPRNGPLPGDYPTEAVSV